MPGIKKKTVIEHLDELIDFYSQFTTSDENLKKLIVRNLKDVKRRAENEIPDNIGVLIKEFNTLESVKKAKKQELKVDSKILFQSMIRSMQRDNARYYKIVNIIKE